MNKFCESYLILGLGELGDAVLRGLAERDPRCRITVLVRPETLTSPSPERKLAFEQLHARGVHFVTADLVAASAVTLAEVLAPFSTVIGCTGLRLAYPFSANFAKPSSRLVWLDMFLGSSAWITT